MNTGVPPYDTCSVAGDRGWGEIDHEILSPADCVCLFGCPYLPLSKDTVDRRDVQYQTYCTPGKDAQGPPSIDCVSGKCAAG